MGLDAVEIVLRTEELFVIAIDDEEAAVVRTVGDLYVLICSKLNVIPLQTPLTSERLPKITEEDKRFLFFSRRTSLPAPPEVLPWSPQSVWDCTVAIFVDQLSLKLEEIRYHSRIAQDLRID